MGTKIIVEVDDDLLLLLNEWIGRSADTRPSHADAMIHFAKRALAPIAISTEAGQTQIADKWQVGRATAGGSERPCLILEAQGQQTVLMLNDQAAAAMAEMLIREVQGPGGSH